MYEYNQLKESEKRLKVTIGQSDRETKLEQPCNAVHVGCSQLSWHDTMRHVLSLYAYIPRRTDIVPVVLHHFPAFERRAASCSIMISVCGIYLISHWPFWINYNIIIIPYKKWIIYFSEKRASDGLSRRRWKRETNIGKERTKCIMLERKHWESLKICIWMTQTRRHRTNSGWANNAVA